MEEQQAEAPAATRSPRSLGPQGRRTRQRLLEAGREVLRDHGYHGTRVDDIVTLAGTSHGTFYLYFANIEELLAVLREECEEAIAELAEAVPTLTPDEEGRALLREWIAAFDDVCLQQSPVVAAHLESTRGQERDPFSVYRALHTKLAQAIAASESRTDPEVAATAIIAMIDRFSFFTPPSSVDRDRDTALETVTQLAHAGLFH